MEGLSPWNETSFVTGVLGRRRQGKDVIAGYLAAERQKRIGLKVLHNGGLAFGEFYDPLEMTASPAEVRKKLEGAVYVITEAHNFFNPFRQMSTAQMATANIIMQMGKFGSSLIWTTQYPERVSGNLIQQTDWAVRVRSNQQAWSTPQSIRAGKPDNRCAGFFAGKPFHKEHLPCLQVETYCGKKPHRFDIHARWTMQKNHPAFKTGRRFSRWQHVFCAHRYYKLNNTGVLVDHTEVLAYNSDALKRRQEAEDLMRLNGVLIALEAGEFTDGNGKPLKLQIVTEAQIVSAFTAMYPDRSMMDAKTVRSHLRSLDVRPKGSTTNGRRYDLTRWKEEHSGA